MRFNPRDTSRDHAHAFSLVEAVMAMGVISLVMVGALNAIGSVAAQQRALVEQARAAALAQNLLGEIMSQPYEDSLAPVFGPEVGELRAAFDDVDDYSELIEAPPAPGLKLLDTTWDGWKRSTRVRYANLADPGATAAADSGLKAITVTVKTPTGRSASVTGLRARSGLYDKAAATSSTYTARIVVSIEIAGDPTTTVQQTAALTNTVP